MKEFVEKLIGRLEESQERYEDVAFMEMGNSGHTFDYEFAEGKKEAMGEAIEIVNQLAEEYNNGWIPCSERLPEANQKVLTCDKDGWISVNVNMPYIGVRNDFECGYYVAWMPLPAPYQKGE